MKKLFTVICTLVLVFTLCSCKSVNDDISGNSSVINPTSTTTDDVISSDNTTTESVGGSTSDVSDGNQSTPPTENNSSTSEKDNISSEPIKENNPSPIEKSVYLTADTSRSPSADVGSIISNGYIYYINPNTGFLDGLFRKKITGGNEETVSNLSISEYRVLNDAVYYIHSFDLYKCNVDGTNVKKLYDNVSSFEVAGNWIFATRYLSNAVATGNIRQELYAISTDGSTVKQIKPDKGNDAGAKVTIHGFNRGYCYVTVVHTYYVAGDPNAINMSSDTLRVRLDYRSKDLIQQELKVNTEYTYNGQNYFSFEFKDINIINDHVTQVAYQKKYAVSLLNNTGTALYESSQLLPQCLLKDYLVYIPFDSTNSNYKIVFSGYDGDIITHSFDLSQLNANECKIYSHQDKNSNAVLLLFENYTTDEYSLQLLNIDGQLTEIYRKSQ